MVAALTQYGARARTDRLYDAKWLLITAIASALAHGYAHIITRRGGLRLLHRPGQGGYDAMTATLTRVFDERPGTSGFIVQNESAVESLLGLLRRQGRAVPEDVSVVAICADPVALQASVQLTAVSIPAEQMGREAVKHIVTKLAGQAADVVELIAPELTVRASSGLAPE
ncbi:substrate-binding domain-containing protein [Streptomyces violascens]|uniref:substrate-binding domain-containing protein n=1 Tax=Streptomyces violascens TaxID=67381 RepID=UPI0036B0BC02